MAIALFINGYKCYNYCYQTPGCCLIAGCCRILGCRREHPEESTDTEEKMSRVITTIDSSGNGMQEALWVTEQVGEDNGLSRRERLRLRLLAEELIGMLRGIAGNIQADYIVENKGRAYTLHLKGDVRLDKEMRRHLMEVSSKGENAAAKGIMGKLRDMIGVMLLPGTAGHAAVYGFSAGLITMGGPAAGEEIYDGAQAYTWSLDKYKSSVQGAPSDEAWDELEKSIVANLADEVRVSIVKTNVDITIFKTFWLFLN